MKWAGFVLAAALWRPSQACDSDNPFEPADCLVPASNLSCLVRCYYPYDDGSAVAATAPDSQV
jgi:hypothetical protein